MRISDWSSDGCSSYLLQQDAAGQRVAVRAQTWGGEADEDVAGLDVLTGDQVVALGGADREAHEVELTGLHRAGVLGHLPADQRAAGLAAAVGDALDELLDVIGVELADRYVVEEEQRLGARSEEHTSELPSLMRLSYAVFCLK